MNDTLTSLNSGLSIPYNEEISLQLITSMKDVETCLLTYSELAADQNPFISQMKISAQTFYQEGL